jgi:hypothetical protein
MARRVELMILFQQQKGREKEKLETRTGERKRILFCKHGRYLMLICYLPHVM